MVNALTARQLEPDRNKNFDQLPAVFSLPQEASLLHRIQSCAVE